MTSCSCPSPSGHGESASARDEQRSDGTDHRRANAGRESNRTELIDERIVGEHFEVIFVCGGTFRIARKTPRTCSIVSSSSFSLRASMKWTSCEMSRHSGSIPCYWNGEKCVLITPSDCLWIQARPQRSNDAAILHAFAEGRAVRKYFFATVLPNTQTSACCPRPNS